MKLLKYLGLGIGIAAMTVLLHTEGVIATKAQPSLSPQLQGSIKQASSDPAQQFQLGKQSYQAGQYAQAIALWNQASQSFANQGDHLNQAVVLSNLALANQQLGQWTEATQAINESLNLLQNQSGTAASKNEVQKLLAQALNIQGNLYLAQGRAEQALTTWQSAARIYQQVEDSDGVTRSLINQTQAYRALGLYPRAKSTLEEVNRDLQTQDNTLLKAAGLLNYGDALRLVGELTASEKALQQSLAIARQLQSAPEITLALLSLGNTARAQQDVSKAFNYYKQAIAASHSPTIATQAQLNQLRLLTDAQRWDEAQALIAEIRPQLEKLPPSRSTVYARVNFAQSILKLSSNNRKASESPLIPSVDLAQILATGAEYGKEINDQRAESYALGHLGELYERNQQFDEARKLTNQALLLSQLSNAPDISYRWQWQLGRILQAQGQSEPAIAVYSQAVTTLNSIRNDLVASSPDIQFSFRESVEPVYREFVALLLEPQANGNASQANLKKAREVIESLQLAELDNFFKEACLTGRPALVDQVDPKSAVVYPIILANRLEVVLSIPNQDLRHYSTSISQRELEQLAENMRRSLRRTSSPRERLVLAQKLYDLLLRPAEADLAAHSLDTLAFVLDGAMKNVPMAALHDGQQYLIEKYNVAVTPGLQLLDPRPLKSQALNVLVGGLSEGRQGFAALPGVETEVQQIKTEVPAQILFNQAFTTSTFQEQISNVPFRVVHLATHGQFSSNADDTFILTWDERIDVKQLGELLQFRDQDTRTPIELLILSACQTAEGDRRAALGLAGVAVRSGARSTLATLWAVDDQSTSQLMTLFYQELAKAGTTKAEALRQAQLKLLKESDFRHPFYWAPFVLVGNWL